VKPIGLEHRCGTGIPGFDLAAAVEWEVSKGLRLGPVLRYQFGSDPRDSNAQLATVGIAFDYGGRTRLPIRHPDSAYVSVVYLCPNPISIL